MVIFVFDHCMQYIETGINPNNRNIPCQIVDRDRNCIRKHTVPLSPLYLELLYYLIEALEMGSAAKSILFIF